MYLHPLIHTELTRQHQADLSRRALRATLIDDRDRQLVPGRGPAKRIRRLIASFATLAVR
jgi:hypothetical protein